MHSTVESNNNGRGGEIDGNGRGGLTRPRSPGARTDFDRGVSCVVFDAGRFFKRKSSYQTCFPSPHSARVCRAGVISQPTIPEALTGKQDMLSITLF